MADRQTDVAEAGWQTDKHTDRQVGGQMDRQTVRQADKQAGMKTSRLAHASPFLNASFAFIDGPLLFLHLQCTDDCLAVQFARVPVRSQIIPLLLQTLQQFG